MTNEIIDRELIAVKINQQEIKLFLFHGLFKNTLEIDNIIFEKHFNDDFLGFYDWLISSEDILHGIEFIVEDDFPDNFIENKNIKLINGTLSIKILENPFLNDDNSLLQIFGESNFYSNESFTQFLIVMDLCEGEYKSSFLSSTKHLEVEDLGVL